MILSMLIDFDKRPGLDRLPSIYDQLNLQIKTSLPNVRKVCLLKYPNIALGCSKILKKFELLNLNSKDIQHAKKILIEPINELIERKCEEFGWIALSPGDWSNHGECKDNPHNQEDYLGFHSEYPNTFPDPYNHNSKKDYSFVRNFEDSNTYQHGDDDGAAHPNSFGHLAIAKELIKHLRPLANQDNSDKKKWLQPFLNMVLNE